MEKKTLEVLSTEVIHYLRKLSYSDSRISQYRSAWQRVAAFMKESGRQYYTASVGEEFIYYLLHDRSYDDLDRWEKDIIQCANVLTEFLETKAVKFRRCQKFRDLPGSVGQTMQNYIAYRNSYMLSRETIEGHKHRLQQFLSFLEDNEIHELKQINQLLLMNYVNQLGFCSPYVRHSNLCVLKRYLRYLYDQGLTETDNARFVPKDKFVKQPKLPSTYTKDEIEVLIAAIDRSSPKGKRDYAMVLITACLGIRATDVCCLSFENIHWEEVTKGSDLHN